MTFLFPLRAEVEWATRFLLGEIYLDDTVEFEIAANSPASTRIRREGKVLTPEIAELLRVAVWYYLQCWWKCQERLTD